VKPKLERRHLGMFAVAAAFVMSRLIYRALGVRFSADPVNYYIQFLDPELLRHDLLRSLFYMRDQPPGFNGFVGVVLKLFPVHYAEAFGVVYCLGGLAFGLVLYALMVRLGVRVWLAALVTIGFVDSPITMLYENWLFYTFPLAVMLCASALFLHRWRTARRFADAVIFFALLGVLVLWRNLFHPLWMLAVVGALLALERRDRAHRRQVALAALGPVLVVCALLVKHVIVFHAIFQGRPIQQMNLAALTSMRLPEAERARLINEHVLIISDVPITAGPNGFRRYVTTPPKTGIPVLDQEYKPKSGYPNWNSSIFVAVGELYGADARWTLAHRPGVYVDAVRENLQRYALPSDQSDPFNTRSYKNRLALQPLLTQWNRLFSWQRAPNRTAVAHVIGFPLLLVFALVLIVRGLRRGRRADALTVAFALYSTLWVSAATLLLSYGDHNRYRFKVSAFYCLFFALAVERALPIVERAITDMRDRGARPTPDETRR
jgi:hypothetical protein